MPRGGKRPGQGRPTRAQELGLPKLIEDVIGEDGKKSIIEILYKMAKTGSFPHLQLFLAYQYGKPVEKHEVDQDTKITVKYEGSINDLIKPV